MNGLKEYTEKLFEDIKHIDKNLRNLNQDKTIGIIICKQDNKYIIKYCSDERIIARKYELVWYNVYEGDNVDIRYTNNEFQFLLRVSILIFNKDESKVLLFNVEGREFYLLPGGKISELEESIDAAKREVKEELGKFRI